MALRIERELAVGLPTYVNMPYFGRGQYGIEAQPRLFRQAGEGIGTPEVAFIVALINKPAPRPFVRDGPRQRTREAIRDANWLKRHAATRVLDLMLDQGVIDEVDHARAADRSRTHSARSCHGHRLRHPRSLSSGCAFSAGIFPINKGGLTISIARRRSAGCPRQGGRADVAYLSRTSSDDLDNAQLRAGAFAVEFTGDVLAEVGNANFGN
jgi:hypothetical protein